MWFQRTRRAALLPLLLVFLVLPVGLILPGCSSLRLLSYVQFPPELHLQDSGTLVFKGAILPETAGAFRQALTPQVQRVVVDSTGGDVEAGLMMGFLIHERDLDVVVDGMCMSSCANYLFIAGRNKVVTPGSVVGFHGEPRNSPSVMEAVQTSETYRTVFERLAAESDRFYALVGVNSHLYAYSAEFTLFHKIDFWVPSPRELTCMGVRNLSGMWFSANLRDYRDAVQPGLLATSAQDRREPKPDICSP